MLDIGSGVTLPHVPSLQWTELLAGLGVTVLAVLAGRLTHWVMRRIYRRRGRSASYAEVFGTLWKWLVTALGVGIAFIVAFPSVNFGSLLSGLGLASLVVGIAGQSILGDLFAGLMMVVREPFREGDQVDLGEIRGTITQTNLRETIVRTFDGRRVLVPNRELHGSMLIVQTGYEHRRAEVLIGVAYGSDFELVRRVILQTAAATPDILDEPAPQAFVKSLGPGYVDIAAHLWTGSTQLEGISALDVFLPRVLAALDRHGVELPPQTFRVQGARDGRGVGMSPSDVRGQHDVAGT